MNIRTAERRDLSAMLDIYNYEVKNGTATFDVEPRAGAAVKKYFATHFSRIFFKILSKAQHIVLITGKTCYNPQQSM